MEININYDIETADESGVSSQDAEKLKELCSEIKTFDLASFATFVLQELHCPDTTDVSISFVSNEEIHELNRSFRGIDRPTDVLSFECDNVPFDFERTPDMDDDDFYFEIPEYELGDIMIAPLVAFEQSFEFNTSFEAEIRLLTVHGLLHLCGYDHIEDDEAEIMEAKERELLARWKSEHN